MVKRACPFRDDMNPQLKIHVNEKEIAKGVMNDDIMKHVYEKTKTLLFLGAKRTSSARVLEPSASRNEMKEDTSKVCGVSSSSLKQLHLTCQGRLHACDDVMVAPPVKEIPCSRCSVWSLAEMCSCSFCDVALCSSCVHICVTCRESFCSDCTFNVYDALQAYVCRHCC